MYKQIIGDIMKHPISTIFEVYFVELIYEVVFI